MRWREQTDRAYDGQVEDALFPGQVRRLLVGRTIRAVEYEEARPGGPNNDMLGLLLDDGTVLRVDAYSGGDMYVTVRRAP